MGNQIAGEQIGTRTGKETEIVEEIGMGKKKEIVKGEKEMKIKIGNDQERKNGITTRIKTGQKEEKRKPVKEAKIQKGQKKL